MTRSVYAGGLRAGVIQPSYPSGRCSAPAITAAFTWSRRPPGIPLISTMEKWDAKCDSFSVFRTFRPGALTRKSWPVFRNEPKSEYGALRAARFDTQEFRQGWGTVFWQPFGSPAAEW